VGWLPGGERRGLPGGQQGERRSAFLTARERPAGLLFAPGPGLYAERPRARRRGRRIPLAQEVQGLSGRPSPGRSASQRAPPAGARSSQSAAGPSPCGTCGRVRTQQGSEALRAHRARVGSGLVNYAAPPGGAPEAKRAGDRAARRSALGIRGAGPAPRGQAPTGAVATSAPKWSDVPGACGMHRPVPCWEA
jgi:hypothetical protein